MRDAAHEIKEHTLRYLDVYLEQFEANCTRAGGHVHWARDADEANRIIVGILKARREREVIKVKTMTSDETRLNAALEDVGIAPYETDLADLIIQLGHDKPSHIVVPALHKNKAEIRELFQRTMGLPDLGTERDRPGERGARLPAREVPARARSASAAPTIAIADTGSVCVVESEGNGRMCLTLPRLLITMVGIEKVIPSYTDLEVFLQLLRAIRDRRADEPLQLDLDRHDGGRRARRVSHRAARQRPDERAGGREARARRSTASAARRASTRVPSIARPAAMRTVRCTAVQSAPS